MIPEIKFKAWDVEEQKMYEWNEFFFYDTSPVTRWSGSFDYINHDNMKLMQYIGKKDSNGVEIYNEHIVNIRYNLRSPKTRELIPYFSTAVIQYNCENCQYELRVINSAVVMGIDRAFLLEVIGNIYQNPELIKLIRR